MIVLFLQMHISSISNQMSVYDLLLIQGTLNMYPQKPANYWTASHTGSLSTIPDNRVGTRSKFSPPPTFNVDNRVIFALFVGKNAIFFNID